MNIKMEMVPDTYQVEDDFPFCFSKITIHEKNQPEVFWETAMTALDYWTVGDYERQWREGLERIKTHATSCLVASVQDPKLAPLINWWPLYKEGNEVFIYNELIVGESYERRIGQGHFTPKTCYDFIQPRVLPEDDEEDGYEVSVWVIDLE